MLLLTARLLLFSSSKRILRSARRPSRFSTLVLQHVNATRPPSSSTSALRYIITDFLFGSFFSVQHIDSSARQSNSSAVVQYVSFPMRGQRDCKMALRGRRIVRFAGGIPGRNESAVVTTVETIGVVTAGEELPPATERTSVTDGIEPASSTVDLNGSRSESFISIQMPA